MDRELFNGEIHQVLRYLYEPQILRKSFLLTLFAVDQKPDAVQALRRILIHAIQSLKPNNRAPVESSEYRNYQILIGRFVEQQSQKEVAADLAVSERQLRRLETDAILALCDHLWLQFQPGSLETVDDSPANMEKHLDELTSSELNLKRLQTEYKQETINLKEFIEAAQKVVEPLFGLLKIQKEYSSNQPATFINGKVEILRQALINLLTAGAQSAPGGTVRIEIHSGTPTTMLEIIATAPITGSAQTSSEITDSIEMAHQLVGAFGGALEVQPNPSIEVGVAAKLWLPSAAPIRVLVMEDNRDVIKLYERYLTGSLYYMTSSQDPTQIFSLVEEYHPQIIVLDIMMPNIDGWEILGQLREHPLTRHIPVLICSILPQESLGFALGAADYIRKPVKRDVFLNALDQQAARLERAPE